MIEVKDYIIRIVIACLICGVLVQLTKTIKGTAQVVKLLCGIFLSLTMLSPIVQLRWTDLSGYLDKMNLEAQTTISQGTQMIYEQKSDSIQRQLEAYILDKAASYDCEVSAEVELSDDDPPMPIRLRISGKVSPYERTQLSNMIETDLGIPKENQIWNAVN